MEKISGIAVLKHESVSPTGEHPLVDRLQKTLHYFNESYGYTTKGRWRHISQISLAALDDQKDAEVVFYADIQSVNGGGTWASAKHRALYAGADYTAPIDMVTLSNMLVDDPEFGSTEMARSIIITPTFEELSKEQLNWLVDVDHGPGIAPGYGGIKIPIKIVYRDETGAICIRHGWVMSSFSGAKDWQDIFIALRSAYDVINAIESYNKTARITCDLSALMKDSSVAFWADLVSRR